MKTLDRDSNLGRALRNMCNQISSILDYCQSDAETITVVNNQLAPNKGRIEIDDVRYIKIEFDSPEDELNFILRWS